MKDIIKDLIKKKAITQEIRYDVSVMHSWDPKKVNKFLAEMNISEDEFKNQLSDYSHERKVFFFTKIDTPWEDIVLTIDGKIAKAKGDKSFPER